MPRGAPLRTPVSGRWESRISRAPTPPRSRDTTRSWRPPRACRATPVGRVPHNRRCRPATRAATPPSFLTRFRQHDRPTALRRPALALVPLQILLGVLVVELVLIVICELRPRRNPLLGVDPDAAALDHRFAV